MEWCPVAWLYQCPTRGNLVNSNHDICLEPRRYTWGSFIVLQAPSSQYNVRAFLFMVVMMTTI